MGLFGYVPNAAQTSRALNVILLVGAIVPAAFMLIPAILIRFYPLTEENFHTIAKEIRARK